MKKIFLSLCLIFCLSSQVLAKPYYYDDYERFDKVIKINTYANKLSYYEKWEKIWEMAISSGDSENFTPRWRFVIVNKSEKMLSTSAGKWMPYWMEFYDWVYWIHALPEDYKWNLDTTSTIWEVAAGWCVRLAKEDAKKLYEWADTKTYVLIDYDKNEYADTTNDVETIKNYFSFLSQEKREEAYNMRLNRGFSLDTFILLNKWYNFEVIEAKQVDGWEYYITTKIFNKKDIKIWTSESKFFISDGKIVRSFVVKRY